MTAQVTGLEVDSVDAAPRGDLRGTGSAEAVALGGIGSLVNSSGLSAAVGTIQSVNGVSSKEQHEISTQWVARTLRR